MGPYCFYLLEDCNLYDIRVKKLKHQMQWIPINVKE